MNRVKCIATHGPGWSGCMSPGACRDWGYCRQRNIDAGGMKNVTPAMQAQWRKEDAPDPEPETVSRSDADKCGQYARFVTLYDATPDCDGRIVSAPGGGVKCTKCRGWFCY